MKEVVDTRLKMMYIIFTVIICLKIRFLKFIFVGGSGGFHSSESEKLIRSVKAF